MRLPIDNSIDILKADVGFQKSLRDLVVKYSYSKPNVFAIQCTSNSLEQVAPETNLPTRSDGGDLSKSKAFEFFF